MIRNQSYFYVVVKIAKSFDKALKGISQITKLKFSMKIQLFGF